jgi:hypothetical protein
MKHKFNPVRKYHKSKKQMKKKLLYAGTLLIAATTMFFGCNPNDETPAAITVADNDALMQEVFADAQTGKSGVSFTTAAAWSSEIAFENNAITGAAAGSQQMRAAAAAPGWISISPDYGDKAGDYTVVITLLPNTTGANRTATITITCADSEISISVTQKGTKEDGTVPDERPQYGGEGAFTFTDVHNNVVGQIEVNGAKFENGVIRFYKDGQESQLYMEMSANPLTTGTYYWCDNNCTGNYFYTQKGTISDVIWYAIKGVVEVSAENNIYTLRIYIETESYNNGEQQFRVDINGTYNGYLTIE